MWPFWLVGSRCHLQTVYEASIMGTCSYVLPITNSWPLDIASFFVKADIESTSSAVVGSSFQIFWQVFYLFDSISSRVFSWRQKNLFIIQSSCHNIIKFSSIQDKETTNYLCFINLCNILSSFFDCSSAPPLLCCLHTNQCSILVTRYCNDLRILGLMSNFKFCCLLNLF